MLKSLLLASCIAVSLGIVSCQQDDVPQPAEPAPVREATINTVFRYYSPDESRGINHLADKPFGQWSSDRLTVKFHNTIPGLNPTDEIQFVLPKSRQKTGLTGTYTLASQPDPGQGDVQVKYLRPGTSSSWNNGVNSNAHVLEGSFIITSYDARRNLISGSYAVEAKDVRDAFVFLASGSSADNRRTGDLRVYGAFTEVPLY